MGYSYNYAGRLCCDECGAALGFTRKRKCPASYCPSPAMCADCWRKVRAEGLPRTDRAPLTWQAMHATCAAKSAASRADDDRRRALMASGVPVRCSALGYFDDTGRVRVLFRVGVGEPNAYPGGDRTVGFDMQAETYHAIPLGTTATPDDYRAHGAIVEAPGDFDMLRVIHAQQDAERRTPATA